MGEDQTRMRAQLALVAAAVGAASAFVPTTPPALRTARSAQISAVSSLSMASVSVQDGPSKIPCERGDTVREVMLNGKAELYYTMKGKLFNCNGNGQCGTCKVELLSGAPASFRLACQTAVDGDVTVRNKPDA